MSLSSDDSIGREELFYQLGLRQFADLSRMKLQPPPSLRSLLQIAVNAEPSVQQSKLTKDQIVDVRVLSIVWAKAHIMPHSHRKYLVC